MSDVAATNLALVIIGVGAMAAIVVMVIAGLRGLR